MQYAGEKALIVVAGLGNSGGLSLNGFSFASDRGIAVLGPNPEGVSALTWSAAPTAKPAGGSEITAEAVAAPCANPQPTAEDAVALLRGPGSEVVAGFVNMGQMQALLSGKL